MSEISEAAWERALDKRQALDTVYRNLPDGGRIYQLGDDVYHVTCAEAAAAQAEIDAEAEVTDDMLDAYAQAVENSHDSDITTEGIRRLRRRGLEAALQARAKRGEK